MPLTLMFCLPPAVFLAIEPCPLGHAGGKKLIMNPRIGEPNLGAVIGAVTGSAGGLLALGIAPAIVTHKPIYLIALPILSIISWLICAIVGWLIGGQIGP